MSKSFALGVRVVQGKVGTRDSVGVPDTVATAVQADIQDTAHGRGFRATAGSVVAVDIAVVPQDSPDTAHEAGIQAFAAGAVTQDILVIQQRVRVHLATADILEQVGNRDIADRSEIPLQVLGHRGTRDSLDTRVEEIQDSLDIQDTVVPV